MIRTDARREEIANHVMKHGQVRIDDLVSHFGVSRMTIHRHVEQLAQQGVLRKLHGAVTVQPSSIHESSFRYRETVAKAEKQALARAALAHVEPGQVVMLDDSTTAAAVAGLICELRPLTLITNSIASAELVRDADEIDLISLGGQYHRTYNAYIGTICETAISRLRANVLICSASAVTGSTAYVQDPQVVRIKQAMMAASGKRILLLDSTKLDRFALHALDDLAAFDAVLVSGSILQDRAKELIDAGARLEIVEGSPS